MTPEELSKTIKESLESLVSSQKLDLPEIPEIKIERPKSKDHGDFASNIALMVSKSAGKNPREVAQLLVDELSKNPGIKKVDIAGPGFLNFTLDSASLGELAKSILEQSDKYGHTKTLNNETINIG